MVSIIGPNTDHRASWASPAVFGENSRMIAAAALSAAGFLGFFAMVVSCLPRDARHYATIAPPLGGAANRLRRRCLIPELTQRILQARFVRFLARTGKSPYAGFVIRQYVLFKVLFQKRSFGLAMGDWC